MTKAITILGSTGSVGCSTLDVVLSNKNKFQVHALTAHTSVSLLAEQAIKSNAKLAVIGDEKLYRDLKTALFGTGIETAAGDKAIIEAASVTVDITMAAIVGMAGLKPILSALRNGKNVAIANKEPLVAAGSLVMSESKKYGTKILPVDSEHNAIFQVLEQNNKNVLRRIILTASGGPFRTWDESQIATATKEQALAHPNWVMGEKISIDSATMMNKALEVIEAHYLFDMPLEKIDVLVHPQSVIHSMVEYCDGSVLAQMGASDMKVPISHALGWPDRIESGAKTLDFSKLSALTFEEVDHRRFPAINIGYDSLRSGLGTCIAMNAANEIAVDAFLKQVIGFSDICKIVQKTVNFAKDETNNNFTYDLGAILDYDAKMRQISKKYILNTQQ